LSSHIKVAFALAILVILPSAELQAGEWSFQVDLVSSFIWRGFDLDPVHHPVVQPSVSYGFGDSGFAIDLWSNFSFESKELHEADLILSYQVPTPASYSLSFGYCLYGWYFADQLSGFDQRTTHEVSVTLGLPEIPLAPELTVFYDLDDGDGLYAALAIAHAVPVHHTTLELSASLGYNGGQWLPDDADTGLSDLNLGVAVPFEWRGTTITPFATYTVVFLDEISEDNHLWYGLSLSW
jgi:hypothetical protein